MEQSQRIRVAGMSYAVGGVIWFLVTATVGMMFGGDPPSDSSAFIPSQLVYTLSQLLLLYGFFGIYWSGALGRGLFGKIAFGFGVLGHILFVVGEIHSLIIRNISDLIAVAAMVSAIGITLTGIAVLLAKRWQGWHRWMPLATGLYFFFFALPFIISAGEPNSFAIAGWGVVRCILGLAIIQQAAVAIPIEARNDGALQQKRV